MEKLGISSLEKISVIVAPPLQPPAVYLFLAFFKGAWATGPEGRRIYEVWAEALLWGKHTFMDTKLRPQSFQKHFMHKTDRREDLVVVCHSNPLATNQQTAVKGVRKDTQVVLTYT